MISQINERMILITTGSDDTNYGITILLDDAEILAVPANLMTSTGSSPAHCL